ncbi:MAG: tRNA preQ1(34) S-adenosylmethionine ribosyltransferase-isomerase QueA [Patescibacteria group bacterium]|jgi:S-adenosylmethionine:tRNA ribosyltransferase-isomerase
MKRELFDYHLPAKLIAQTPISPRDSSRLLVYDRQTEKIRHDFFYNLQKYLTSGDILVFNDTKVFPARLWGRKITGGRMEIFLLKPLRGQVWEALVGGKARRAGLIIKFSHGLECTTVKKLEGGIWQVRFNKTRQAVYKIADQIGSTPTPPYVKKLAKLSDYQTVYASKVGSVAAPTAGFHFTKRLLARLKNLGVQFEYVTLHVGYGTFQPVKVKDIEKHQIHVEYAEADLATLKRLIKAKQEGRRVIAVGTTTVRVLETVFQNKKFSRGALALRRDLVRARALTSPQGGFKSWINTFIYPGYKFKMVDAMITNFHLPQSSLLMLVSAFAGRQQVLKIYNKAVQEKYRFYSFGDGMLIV